MRARAANTCYITGTLDLFPLSQKIAAFFREHKSAFPLPDPDEALYWAIYYGVRVINAEMRLRGRTYPDLFPGAETVTVAEELENLKFMLLAATLKGQSRTSPMHVTVFPVTFDDFDIRSVLDAINAASFADLSPTECAVGAIRCLPWFGLDDCNHAIARFAGQSAAARAEGGR